jgi:hypothetical protein
METEYDHHKLEIGLEKVLEIAAERKTLLEKLRRAIIDDECIKIKKYSRLLCGLREET